jgi:hypothetical protein
MSTTIRKALTGKALQKDIIKQFKPADLTISETFDQKALELAKVAFFKDLFSMEVKTLKNNKPE